MSVARQLRHAVNVTAGATPASGTAEYWDGDIPWATPEDVGRLREGYWLHDTRRKLTQEGYANCGATMAPEHSIVLTKRAPIGQLAVLSMPACCNQGCFLLTPRYGHDTRFVYYLLTAQADLLQALGRGSTFMELATDDLKALKLGFPVLPRQRAIAAYLDRETAKIDAMIAAKERLLTLLAEKRRALITHAATRGLNPDAPKKDSGVEWLGEIPEHWSIERAKWLLAERDERSITGEEELLTVSHITGVTPRSEKDVTMFEAESKEGYKVCRPGDLVINTLWAWMGAMGIARHHGIVSPAYHVYEVNDRLSPDYVEAMCRTQLFADETRRFSKGVWSSRLRLYPEGLHCVQYPIPPLDEQREITRRLAEEEQKTTAMRNALERSLDLARERRSALIAAAVTGQIDVEAAA